MRRRLLGGFLQKRQPGFHVLGHFVTFGKRINGAFLGLAAEIVEGDLLATLEGLLAFVKEVGFAGFLADNGEWHGRVELRLEFERKLDARPASDDAGFLQGVENAVLVRGLERPRRELHRDVPVQFAYPEAARPKIGGKGSWNDFRHVLADPAFLLREAAPVNDRALGWPGLGDAANSHGCLVSYSEGRDNGGAIQNGQVEFSTGDSGGFNRSVTRHPPGYRAAPNAACF